MGGLFPVTVIFLLAWVSMQNTLCYLWVTIIIIIVIIINSI